MISRLPLCGLPVYVCGRRRMCACTSVLWCMLALLSLWGLVMYGCIGARVGGRVGSVFVLVSGVVLVLVTVRVRVRAGVRIGVRVRGWC